MPGCSRHGSRIDAAVRGELASAGVVATSSVIELRPLVLPEGTLSGMPVLIGATSGTERHSLVLEHALRPMFSHLHAIVLPTGVYAATDASTAPPGPGSASVTRNPSTPNSADAVSWNTMPAALY